MTENYRMRLARNAPLIIAACEKHGVPPEWGLAIARQESSFRPTVSALHGGDGRRGGAYGLMQMTYRTAQGLGYRGVASDLLDPTLNADLGAKLLAQLSKQYKGALRDVAAAYNSGKPYAKAPAITRNLYVRNIEKYVQEFADYLAEQKTPPTV